MGARRYAEDTAVSVEKSRFEIKELLVQWGCSGIGWMDDFNTGLARLQFRWSRDEVVYVAQFDIRLPDDEALKKKARHATSLRFLPAKFETLRGARGRSEHRVMFLWIKAALNAVEAGIIDPATIFLPFLVGRDGRTFAEAALPRLPELLQLPSADRLLGDGR